jgi:hypothetical protein
LKVLLLSLQTIWGELRFENFWFFQTELCSKDSFYIIWSDKESIIAEAATTSCKCVQIELISRKTKFLFIKR